jgi:DNA-binding MarR family transcriptional regulator
MKAIEPSMKDSWGYLLHDVSKLLKRRFEEEAKDYGITLPQWRVLAQIGLGKDSRQASLAASIDVDPMTMSGILDRLEKRSLITRMPDPADSRAKLAAITPAGDEIVLSARAVGLRLLEEASRGLSKKDQDQLKALLGKVRNNLQGEDARTKDL